MKKRKTIAQLKKQCWDLFSQWVRRKDADVSGMVRCYTCRDLHHWKEIQAGHFVPGRTGAVLLHPDVVKPQCVRCNIFLGGNYHAYTLRMLDELGRVRVDELLALQYITKKWNRTELEAIRDHYKAELVKLDTRYMIYEAA